MNTVVLEVRSLADTLADATRAMKTGRGDRVARITFATPEMLWQVLTAKRWDLLKALSGAGPVSIREAARRVGRNVKAVHGDVTALLDAGILNRVADGRVEFPFQAVKVEFMLQAAWLINAAAAVIPEQHREQHSGFRAAIQLRKSKRRVGAAHAGSISEGDERLIAPGAAPCLTKEVISLGRPAWPAPTQRLHLQRISNVIPACCLKRSMKRSSNIVAGVQTPPARPDLIPFW
jgi:predicted transcriptional regulator